jgi:hypothetical protein
MATADNRHSTDFMISQLTAVIVTFHYCVPFEINPLPFCSCPSSRVREFETSNAKMMIFSDIAISMELWQTELEMFQGAITPGTSVADVLEHMPAVMT